MITMDTRYKAQKKAIKRLENALKACADTDIRIFGVDNQLIWVDETVRQQIYDAERPESRHVLHYTDVAMDEGDIIKDHGCYVDSGGA